MGNPPPVGGANPTAGNLEPHWQPPAGSGDTPPISSATGTGSTTPSSTMPPGVSNLGSGVPPHVPPGDLRSAVRNGRGPEAAEKNASFWQRHKMTIAGTLMAVGGFMVVIGGASSPFMGAGVAVAIIGGILFGAGALIVGKHFYDKYDGGDKLSRAATATFEFAVGGLGGFLGSCGNACGRVAGTVQTNWRELRHNAGTRWEEFRRELHGGDSFGWLTGKDKNDWSPGNRDEQSARLETLRRDREIADLEATCNAHPEDWEVAYDLVDAYETRGSDEGAIQTLERFLNIKPGASTFASDPTSDQFSAMLQLGRLCSLSSDPKTVRRGAKCYDAAVTYMTSEGKPLCDAYRIAAQVKADSLEHRKIRIDQQTLEEARRALEQGVVKNGENYFTHLALFELNSVLEEGSQAGQSTSYATRELIGTAERLEAPMARVRIFERLAQTAPNEQIRRGYLGQAANAAAEVTADLAQKFVGSGGVVDDDDDDDDDYELPVPSSASSSSSRNPADSTIQLAAQWDSDRANPGLTRQLVDTYRIRGEPSRAIVILQQHLGVHNGSPLVIDSDHKLEAAMTLANLSFLHANSKSDLAAKYYTAISEYLAGQRNPNDRYYTAMAIAAKARCYDEDSEKFPSDKEMSKALDLLVPYVTDESPSYLAGILGCYQLYEADGIFDKDEQLDFLEERLGALPATERGDWARVGIHERIAQDYITPLRSKSYARAAEAAAKISPELQAHYERLATAARSEEAEAS